jgi:hypothetical protein
LPAITTYSNLATSLKPCGRTHADLRCSRAGQSSRRPDATPPRRHAQSGRCRCRAVDVGEAP